MDHSQLEMFYRKAQDELDYFRPMQYEISSLVTPNRDDWLNEIVVPGERLDLNIFNSHPQVTTKNWAAQMVSFIMPIGYKFFKLLPELPLNDPNPPSEADIEKASDQLFQIIMDSNCYQAVNESFVDLASGTGGFIINFDKNSRQIYFQSLQMSKVSFLEDHTGKINYVFRTYPNLDKASILLMFPDIADKILESSTRISLIECVYPNPDGKFTYMICDPTFKNPYKMEITNTNPFIIFRWSKRTGENRGRGILNDLLGTIKVANKMKQDTLNAAALALSPPIVTDDPSLMNGNNVRIEPGGIISVRPDAKIMPFPTSPNLPFGYDAVEKENQVIDMAFMTNSLGVPGQQNMTATEITARMQQTANITGAGFNRVSREMSTPMFARLIDIAISNGLMEPITTIQGSDTKRKVRLKFSSPITDAEKTIEAQRLMQAIQYTDQATGDGTFIKAGFKVEELPFYISKSLGVSMSMVRTQDECQNILKTVAQQKQQQQQIIQNPALNAPINTGVFQGA